MANIFLSFFAISVSISLMVVVLLLLTPFLNKRYAAKWKYLIWIFLALRLLVPFRGVSGQFVMDMLSQRETQPALKSEEIVTDIDTNTDTDTGTPANVTVPSGRIIVQIPKQMTTPISVQPQQSNAGITILDIVAIVWILGSIISISVHFSSYFHYKRQVMKKGRIITDTHILSQMSELERELHIRHTIQAMEYQKATSPMIIGFWKPVLVLPKEQYSLEELYFILKHELVHLKRGDIYFKLLFVAANAVHWFNPFIWMMQKEAAVDVELSCDERVTQGFDYAVRKAYTETLLSTIHKQCAKRMMLSTQFYGGKKIMKRRFKNILLKSRKKNGIPIFVGTVILTICLGTLVGYSITKVDTGNAKTNQTSTKKADTGKTDTGKAKTDKTKARKSTTTLSFLKEGQKEKKQATLAVGNGYSIYLPDKEWKQTDSNLWTCVANEQVRLWITHYDDKSINTIKQQLADDGYVKGKARNKKQEGDLLYYAELKKWENDIWGVFYCFPIEAKEGWGKELPVIADTFAISVQADQAQSSRTENASQYLKAADCRKMQAIVDAFAAAYFDGDIDTMKKYLASTYEGEIETYEGTGKISDVTVKGLSDDDTKKVNHKRYVVSLQFRDSDYEDMFWYLTVGFIKQKGNWKIEFYGLEG